MTQPLTTHEAAEQLRCHEKTIRRMIGRGDLDATFVAGRWLIQPEDLPTNAPARPAPPRRVRQAPPSGSLRALVDQMDRA